MLIMAFHEAKTTWGADWNSIPYRQLV